MNYPTLTIVSKHQSLNAYFNYVNSTQPSQLEEQVLNVCEVVSNKKIKKIKKNVEDVFPYVKANPYVIALGDYGSMFLPPQKLTVLLQLRCY